MRHILMSVDLGIRNDGVIDHLKTNQKREYRCIIQHRGEPWGCSLLEMRRRKRDVASNPHAGTSHAGMCKICKIRYGIVHGCCNLQAESFSVRNYTISYNFILLVLQGYVYSVYGVTMYTMVYTTSACRMSHSLRLHHCGSFMYLDFPLLLRSIFFPMSWSDLI